jgi:hypothetical protein
VVWWVGVGARKVLFSHPKGADNPGSFAARFPASSWGRHLLKSLWFWVGEIAGFLLWVSLSELRMRTRFARVLISCCGPFGSL